MRAPFLTQQVLPIWMEKATTRAILLLLFTSGEVPQSTSAHHVLVTVLLSAAGPTPISFVSKKGKSLTMVVAVSRATSLLRAGPARTPSLPALFGLCVQPGTLHKRYSNEKLQTCRQKCLLGLYPPPVLQRVNGHFSLGEILICVFYLLSPLL